ncbi:MAG: serine hydrolase domain-containing protein [Anaerolineaceae bacterium]|nr:serine hydrolase domain-containing protein [Anaerolineaceae bacterium]
MTDLNFDTLAVAIDQQLRKQPFSGVIHVAHQETPIFSHAYGFANRSDKLPNRLNTRFGIASGGKIFTATAICQLVAGGQLSFDQPLSDILVDLPPKLDSTVTIKQLITHTSGIPDYFDEETETDYEMCWREKPVYLMRTANDFLPFIQDKGMKFKPGERFSYNNMGFVFLGLVIEKVSGKRFQDYIQERIFGSAWMRSSGYFSTDRLPENCASGYIVEEDGSWRSNVFSVPIIGHGDGGTFTIAADIGRFWRALWNKTYFGDEILTKMTSPQVRVKPENPNQYGYGVWVGDLTGHRCLSIVGDDPGVEFSSSFYPDCNLQITLLANTNGSLWQLEKMIRSEIFSLDQE